MLAARSAYIGGAVATATVAAGYLWGIPTSGTMSHSYVMGFASELDAFCAFLRDQPDRPTLLIDTYETLAGARAGGGGGRPTGVAPAAVRLDSGDVDALSRGCARSWTGPAWPTPASSARAIWTSTGSPSWSPPARRSTGSAPARGWSPAATRRRWAASTSWWKAPDGR